MANLFINHIFKCKLSFNKYYFMIYLIKLTILLMRCFMKIYIYRYGSICEPDIIDAFKRLGFQVDE